MIEIRDDLTWQVLEANNSERTAKQYRIKPVLLETFVETERFAGTCYKAANWVHVGTTKGRGKLGPSGKQSVPIKDIWLYPFDKNFKKILTA